METNNSEVSPTPEKQLEIKRFSEKAKEDLREKGYSIFELKKQSMLEMERTYTVEAANFTEYDYYMPDFNAQRSIGSEVAVNLSEPFLPKSNNKTDKEQDKMVEKFSKKLEKEIPGIKAFIGTMADHVEIANIAPDYLSGQAKGEYTITRESDRCHYAFDVGRTNKGIILRPSDNFINSHVAPIIKPI